MNLPFTEKLGAFFLADIEKGRKHPYAQRFGYDWCDLSEEEAFVFDLTLNDMPIFVSLWMLNEFVWGAADGYEDGHQPNLVVVESFKKEHPWILEKVEAKVCMTADFQKFGEIFGVTYKLSNAFHLKRFFWDVRDGQVNWTDGT